MSKIFFSLCFLAISISTFAAPRQPQRQRALPATFEHRAPAYTSHHTKPLIILDPGHGGNDEGAKIHSFLEKRLALKTALLTKRYLEELGYPVIMTRGKDIFISLQKRVAIANKNKDALFVSVHYNSSPNPDAKGIEVYYYDNRENDRPRLSKKLANCILYQLIDQTAARSRGVKQGNFHVIRETKIPAVLIEGGFMTNLEERKHLRDQRYLEKISKGIAYGVDKFLKS